MSSPSSSQTPTRPSRSTDKNQKRPVFATPLTQSTRSDILTWRFPPPFSQYVLTGRSRAAWHTSFVVPALGLLLDAGLVVGRERPKNIFLTHGHNDHSMLAPVFVKREDPPDIFCPVEMVAVFDDYINANRMLNLGGLCSGDEAVKMMGDEEEEEKEEEAGEAKVWKKGEVKKEKEKRKQDKDDEMVVSSRSSSPGGLLRTHITHGVQVGDEFSPRRKPEISVLVLPCVHSVPSVGYLFQRVTQRLKAEYGSLPAARLRELRLAGEELTAPHTVPIFAFMGDTTAEALSGDLGSWLERGVPVVVTECTFLKPEHRAQAERTKHTIWAELEPVVRRWPGTTFVLTHFSLRYTEAEVMAFFDSLMDPPGNIVVWAEKAVE